MQVTAKLKNVKIAGSGNRHMVAFGNIYEDVRERWPDGTQIRTSRISKIKDNYIHTLNSVYEIVGQKIDDVEYV